MNYSINLPGPNPKCSISGWANLSLLPDGSYNYSGSIHSSNVLDYNVAVVIAVEDKSTGTVFSSGVQQLIKGVAGDPLGSHNWNWDNSGNNSTIRDLWNDLVPGPGYQYKSAANVDLNSTWNDVKTDMGYISDVVSLVGSLT